MKKIVGYISSDLIKGGVIPQSLQNLAIRNFISKNEGIFLQSWTEHHGRSPYMLEALLSQNFYDGICFFSIEQITHLEDVGQMMTNCFERGLWLGFALEEMKIESKEELESLLKIIPLKKILDNNREDLLWLIKD